MNVRGRMVGAVTVIIVVTYTNVEEKMTDIAVAMEGAMEMETAGGVVTISVSSTTALQKGVAATVRVIYTAHVIVTKPATHSSAGRVTAILQEVRKV